MSNQHTGAPVLKGGLLQCYQLQARVYGGLALRPRQGPGLLNAAPACQTFAGFQFVTGSFVRLPRAGEGGEEAGIKGKSSAACVRLLLIFT